MWLGNQRKRPRLLFRRFLGQIVRFRGAAEHACGVFLYRGGEVGVAVSHSRFLLTVPKTVDVDVLM